jgi:Zn-finger nucleic acid-binding protein
MSKCKHCSETLGLLNRGGLAYGKICISCQKKGLHRVSAGSSKIELKRKCNHCKKIWHVLKSNEEKIEGELKGATTQQGCSACTGCLFWPALFLTNQHASQRKALEKQIHEFRTCPNCRSVNYDEREVKIKNK